MNENMNRVNMDKFVGSFEGLRMCNNDRSRSLDFRCFRSGSFFYIVKELGLTKENHIIWSMNLGRTEPDITLCYGRFNDKLKMPSKKIWHKRECTFESIVENYDYTKLALESYFSLTLTQFLLNNIDDRFINVKEMQDGNSSVLRGGLPSKTDIQGSK